MLDLGEQKIGANVVSPGYRKPKKRPNVVRLDLGEQKNTPDNVGGILRERKFEANDVGGFFERPANGDNDTEPIPLIARLRTLHRMSRVQSQSLKFFMTDERRSSFI